VQTDTGISESRTGQIRQTLADRHSGRQKTLRTKMNNSIAINFGTPEHGWLPVDLSYLDYKINIDASDIHRNSLEQICDALLNLNADKKTNVTWFLEPAEIVFEFEKKATNYFLNIYECAEDENKPWELKKTISGGFAEIILPFIKSVTTFYLQPHGEHWPNIDKNKLTRLKSLTADT
jgi:hypothetical protein